MQLPRKAWEPLLENYRFKQKGGHYVPPLKLQKGEDSCWDCSIQPSPSSYFLPCKSSLASKLTDQKQMGEKAVDFT